MTARPPTDLQVAHGPDTAPRHRFTARLPDSLVGFELPVRDASLAPVHDAAAGLAAAEPWWCLIEDWLGHGLAPEWVAPDAAPPAFAEHAVLAHPGLGLAMHLPLSALRAAGGAPPAGLAAWQWSTLACDLVFDSVPLQPADVAGLHAGALVLMPAAFASAWHGRVAPRDLQAGHFTVLVHEQRGRLSVTPLGQATGHPSAEHLTVRAVAPVPARPSQLLGWVGAKPPPLEAPPLQGPSAVRLHAPAARGGHPVAEGQLVPVGSGYAVRIERLCDRPDDVPADPIAATAGGAAVAPPRTRAAPSLASAPL